jgi:CHAD domain-containing protein
MNLALQQITEELDSAYRALSIGYDPEQLYILRVRIRRIRSILKHADNHRVRSFRKSWGGFAAVTNDSRDWDVFLSSAETLLSAEDFKTFERINAERVVAAHDASMEMIRSSTWRRHLDDWRKFLEQFADLVPGPGQLQEALDRALAKARRALEFALASDMDRSWHKFRIAIKEVRYVADTGAADPVAGQYFTDIADRCRSLQTLLGNWHDTVVQLGLLEELEEAPVHAILASTVRERKGQLLAEIHAELADNPLFR